MKKLLKSNYLSLALIMLFIVGAFMMLPKKTSAGVAIPLYAVDSFTLISADTLHSTDIQQINSSNNVINLCKLPTNKLSIRANASPNTVSWVKFAFDTNNNYHNELQKPYTLKGNLLGYTIKSTELSTVGLHTIKATPYGGFLGLVPGLAKTEVFNVYDDCTPPATPTHLLPIDNTYATTSNQALIDWETVTDPSSPVTYKYQSSNSFATNPDGSFVTPAYSSGILSDSQISTIGTLEGVYYWHVKAIDALGNESAWSKPWKITVDNSAPVTDLNFTGIGPTAKSFDVVFNEPVNSIEAQNPANYFLNNWPGAGGSGDLSGDAAIAYNNATNTATVTFLSNNWYVSPEQNWGVQGIHDLAGNLLNPNPTSEYSTPMVAPTTSANLSGAVGLDGKYATDVTVNLSSIDPIVGSGVKATYFGLDGSGYFEGSSVLISTDGAHNICYYSVDNAGNSETPKCDISFNVDQTAPLVPSHTNPTDNSYLNTPDFTFSWATINDSSEPVSYDWEGSYSSAVTDMGGKFVGSLAATHTGLSTSFVYSPGTPDNVYYWHVRAVDAAGNKSDWSTPWAVIIDTQKPMIKINGPETISITVGNAYVEQGASAIDNHDGNFLATPTGNVNTAIPGVYTITYNATDSSGNAADSVTRVVTVNAVPLPLTSVATLPTVFSRALGLGVAGGTASEPTNPTTTVLGTETAPKSDNNQANEVLGATTAKVATAKNWFGFAWYWWLLALTGLIILFFVIYKKYFNEQD